MNLFQSQRICILIWEYVEFNWWCVISRWFPSFIWSYLTLYLEFFGSFRAGRPNENLPKNQEECIYWLFQFLFAKFVSRIWILWAFWRYVTRKDLHNFFGKVWICHKFCLSNARNFLFLEWVQEHSWYYSCQKARIFSHGSDEYAWSTPKDLGTTHVSWNYLLRCRPFLEALEPLPCH